MEIKRESRMGEVGSTPNYAWVGDVMDFWEGTSVSGEGVGVY